MCAALWGNFFVKANEGKGATARRGSMEAFLRCAICLPGDGMLQQSKEC